MTATRYSNSAIILHWSIAFALAFQLALGFTLEAIPRGAGQFSAYQFHKSLGILILALTIVRIAIRLLHKRPEALADPPWAQRSAKLVHLGLYAFMIAAPLSGWLLVSTAKIEVATLLFGTIPLPHLPVSQNFGEIAEEAHELLAFLGIGLFVLHVAGALRHQLFGSEPVMQRIVPLAKHGSRGAIWIAGALIVMAALATAGIAPRWVAQPTANAASKPVQVTPPAISPVPPEAVVSEPASQVPEAGVNKDTKTDATPASWTITPGGRLGFTARMTDAPIQGRFSQWKAEVTLNPESLESANIRVDVDLSSADTGDSQRDDMLKGGDFFDVSVHPRAVFSSQSVKKTGTERYVADGVLSLHGRNHPVRLTFTLKINGDKARVSGNSQLLRTRFGVGSGEWAVTDQIADAVDIDFSFSATRR